MNIELVKPSLDHKDPLIEMLIEWKNDIVQNHTNSSPWKIFANDFNDFEYYIENLDTTEDNKDGWVPTQHYSVLIRTGMFLLER